MRAYAQLLSFCLGVCTAFPSSVSDGNHELPIHTNIIQRFPDTHSQRGNDQVRALKRVFLSNRSITCNDGSQAGFYLRKSHTSKKWIIFLEGGWYCYDHQSCRNRWIKQRHSMTSSHWPETKSVEGILSPSIANNRFWWNANHVYVPYCTSDSWSGSKPSQPGDMFSFMGSAIVHQVVKDLVPLGLENSTDLLLSGSSAGGTGVMLNLDPIRELLNENLGLKQIVVKGITDSGWFLDRTPYAPTLKPAVVAIKKGMAMWQGKVPRRCREMYISEPWRCYFGYRLYPTLKSELFVFQWLFDEAQMDADNVGTPVTKQQWDYIHKMGDALRQSFENVSAVFAPSCISHSVLTKADWEHVKIDDISIAEALHCWEQKVHRRKIKHSKARRTRGGNISTDQPRLHKNTERRNYVTLNTSMSEDPQIVHKKRKKIKQRKHRRCKGRADNLLEENRNCSGNQTRSRPENRGSDSIKINTLTSTEKRPQHSLLHAQSQRQRQKIRAQRRRCAHRRLERCSWPQCNHSCPRLQDPFTGEEMDFIELLKSFGLDMEGVADALGIDMQTLNNMDHSDLLNLLTQQAN